ncbi:unnamed protein product [Discosporangium mesarthrocarpum]
MPRKMTVGAALVARSLKDASRLGPTGGLRSLVLRSSDDLVCRNLMCEKLGGPCACRLAVTLSRLGGLKELDISGNGLGILPDTVFELTALERLNISGNNLMVLPPGISALAELRSLRMSDNFFTHLPEELLQLKRLEELHVDGNVLGETLLQKLGTALPRLKVGDGNHVSQGPT